MYSVSNLRPPPRRCDSCEVQVLRFIYFGKNIKHVFRFQLTSTSAEMGQLWSPSVKDLYILGKNIKHVYCFQLTSESGTAVKSKCERFIYFGKNIKHVFRFQLTSTSAGMGQLWSPSVRDLYILEKNIKHVFCFQLASKSETAVKSKCERFIYFGKKYITCILFPTRVQVWDSCEVQVREIYIFWEKI